MYYSIENINCSQLQLWGTIYVIGGKSVSCIRHVHSLLCNRHTTSLANAKNIIILTAWLSYDRTTLDKKIYYYIYHNWTLCVVTHYVGLFTDTCSTYLVKTFNFNASHWIYVYPIHTSPRYYTINKSPILHLYFYQKVVSRQKIIC